MRKNFLIGGGILGIVLALVVSIVHWPKQAFQSVTKESVSVDVQNQETFVQQVSPVPAQVAEPTGKPAKTPTSTSKPTITPSASASPTHSVTYTTGPVGSPMSTTPTPTPTPTPDTQPPVFQSMTGPADGTTISFNSFCFPMYVTDNVSVIATGLMVRYSFDNSGFSEWRQDFAPCYQNVSEGSHTFTVQAKDGIGNTTNNVTRTFTVQVLE